MNTQETLRTLVIDGESYGYHSLPAAAAALPEIAHLPRSLRVLAENLLRQGDHAALVKLAANDGTPGQPREIGFRPARILMQDFTGVPAVADLAAMRDAARTVNVPVERINPQTPVDLVIDHSVMVDQFAADSAFARNVDLEFERNRERYEFLRWGAGAFDNFFFGSYRRAPVSVTRSISSILRRLCGSANRMDRRLPTRTPWWGLTAIRPWSTDSRFWAGASEELKPKPPCSVMPSRCWCPTSWGFA